MWRNDAMCDALEFDLRDGNDKIKKSETMSNVWSFVQYVTKYSENIHYLGFLHFFSWEFFVRFGEFIAKWLWPFYYKNLMFSFNYWVIVQD